MLDNTLIRRRRQVASPGALTFGAGGKSPLSFDFQTGRFFANSQRQSSIYDIAPDLERAGNTTTVDENGNVVYVAQNRFAYTEFGLFSSDAWVRYPSGTTTLTVDNGDAILEQNGTNTTTASAYWQGSGATTIDVGAGEKHTIIFDISQETGNHDWVYVLWWTGSGQQGQRIWLDLENQVEGTQNSDGSLSILDSYDVEFLGNGVARVTITASRTTAGSIFPLAGMVDGDTKIVTTPNQTTSGSIRISNPACFRYPMEKVPTALRTAGASPYFLANPDAGERYLARTEHHLYDGTGWTKKRLALSSAVTGLHTDSEDATPNDNNVTTTRAVGDDGWAEYTVVPDATNAAHYTSLRSSTTISYTSGSAYTMQAVLKARGDQRYAWLFFPTVRFPNTERAVGFDLLTGAVDTEDTNTVGHIKDLGSGYYLCAVTATAAVTSTSLDCFVVLSNASGGRAPTYTGDTADGVFVKNLMVIEGSVPQLYCPTFGASVSFVADNDLAFANALIPSYTDRFGVAAKFEFTYADENANPQLRVFRWTDGTNAMELDFRTGSTSTGRVVALYGNATDGNGSVSAATSYTPGVEVRVQAAALWTDTDTNVAADGTSNTQSLATQIPTPTGDVDNCMDIASGSGIIYVEQFQINTSSALTVTDTETVTA